MGVNGLSRATTEPFLTVPRLLRPGVSGSAQWGLKVLFLVHTGLVPTPKLPKVPPQAPTLWVGLVPHILLMYPRTLTLNRMAPSSVLGAVGLALP